MFLERSCVNPLENIKLLNLQQLIFPEILSTNILSLLVLLGVYIINLKKTWEKLLLAARAIVAIENPADVCVISSRNTGQVNA